MKLNYFNFKKIQDKILLTNDCGNFIFLNIADFKNLLAKQINLESPIGKELLSSRFIYDESDLHFSADVEYELRNMKSHLATATSLHIFVVTTVCNLNCIYCQANNGTSIPNCFMDEEIAERAVDIALQSPERRLSFEFQGGEPLLNFTMIKHIVEYTKIHNRHHEIVFNLVSNLTIISDEMLDFFSENNFGISTSLDGSECVHNSNRPFRDGNGSFKRVIYGINKVKEKGLHIGAIQTTTRYSFDDIEKMISTYLEYGFDSIFVRHLTQLGKAKRAWETIGYTAEEFLNFYTSVLDRLIELNKTGVHIREQHSAILLKRILGKRMNYMELRSPCGAGVGQLAYFADGRIFTCDEGRMLAEMGDDAFQLGDVFRDTYTSLIKNRVCYAVCSSSMLETIPSCCDCVYQPYCGICPVVSYAIHGDIIEKHPHSFRCKVYEGIQDYLFKLLLDKDAQTIQVLKSWSE